MVRVTELGSEVTEARSSWPSLEATGIHGLLWTVMALATRPTFTWRERKIERERTYFIQDDMEIIIFREGGGGGGVRGDCFRCVECSCRPKDRKGWTQAGKEGKSSGASFMNFTIPWLGKNLGFAVWMILPHLLVY